jgi:hypothetical protein
MREGEGGGEEEEELEEEEGGEREGVGAELFTLPQFTSWTEDLIYGIYVAVIYKLDARVKMVYGIYAAVTYILDGSE